MNTKLNKIFKSFEDVKLESQKVELSLADDLKQSISVLIKAKESVNMSIKAYEDSYKKMQTEAKGGNSILTAQGKLINTIEAKAKDLGINPSTIPSYNEVNKSWEDLSIALDKVSKF